MSGTSADGIDACLVEISGNGIHTKANILAFETYPYDKTTRLAILETCNPKTGSVDKVCQLNFHLGKLFADAAKAIANKARMVNLLSLPRERVLLRWLIFVRGI